MDQAELLKFAIEKLEQLDVPYALVGSFASSIWGESRLTQDIDIAVELRPERVAALCAAFPDPEFYVSQAAADEAVRDSKQFNVLNPSSGNKIDFMVVENTPWSIAQFERRKQVSLFPDQLALVAAPEDVILGKLIYYRDGGSEKHLRDITGILSVSESLIDHEYLSRYASQLDVADLWEALLRTFRRR